MYLLAPFILQNLKKILTTDPELWECAIFEPKMAQFAMNKIFLVQAIIITFIYLLAFFIVQNFKKFLQQIQIYDAPFWAQNGPFAPCKIFLEIY